MTSPGRIRRLLALLLAAAAAARPAGADDLDDVLGGFEDEVPQAAAVEPGEAGAGETGWLDRFDLTGSASLAASVAYLDHRSRALPLRTDFDGLQRLRTKLNLQLDVDLGGDWKARASGFAWYDWAYRINTRHEYTHHVLNDYESWWDLNELWVQGSPLESLDLKLGRQIVNWGRSDSLRVVDVINPLDNREPGLMDIEDLRRPVGMARVDYYLGDWSVTALVIPELRFDRDPAWGSDFNPSPFAIPSDEPRHWGATPEAGGAVQGIFEGWDVSLYGGWFVDNRPVLELDALIPPPPPPPVLPPIPIFELRSGRFGMVGAGGNYTWGSWLFKAELAFFVDRKLSVPASFASLGVRKDQLDAMGGVEYYGITDTTFAIEVANRRILDYDGLLRGLVEKNSIETAIRCTSDFLNQRLQVTVLALLFGETAQDGSAVRLQADYDLRDALELSGGLLLFQDGDSFFFDTAKRNDRLFAQIKYSF
jgi:hypothetical protein